MKQKSAVHAVAVLFVLLQAAMAACNGKNGGGGDADADAEAPADGADADADADSGPEAPPDGADGEVQEDLQPDDTSPGDAPEEDVLTPTIYFSENWDSGDPPSCWPCKTFPDSCCGESFNGWEPRDWDCNTTDGQASGLTTDRVHSPPRSYYQNRPANAYSTCDISRWLPEPYPSKIHLRFYAYFTSNWEGYDNPPDSTDEWVHFIFTNTALSGTGYRIDILESAPWIWPPDCNSEAAFPGMYFLPSDNTEHCGAGCAPDDCWNIHEHLEEWICVEFMMDAAGDLYSLWINGDQKIDGNSSIPITQENFTRIILSGWNSILRDYTGDFYIDDIVVADDYVGCM